MKFVSSGDGLAFPDHSALANIFMMVSPTALLPRVVPLLVCKKSNAMVPVPWVLLALP